MNLGRPAGRPVWAGMSHRIRISGEAGPGPTDAAPVADESGEIRAGGVGRHGPVPRIEIDATEVIRGQSGEQRLGTLSGRDPLLLSTP